MPPRPSITILHLSDPQFGRNNRFAGVELVGDRPPDALLRGLTDDLDELRGGGHPAPDLVIVTGDLAEWGRRAEFEMALAFIGGLLRHLQLGPERLAVIPGNHDINRDDCEAYFGTCRADEVRPVVPYWPKLAKYAEFFERLWPAGPALAPAGPSARTFAREQPWSWFAFDDLKVVVAGFNSTMLEVHLKERPGGEGAGDDIESYGRRCGMQLAGGHFGFCGEHQIDWFARRLAKSREDGWLRIAAVHHNLRRGAVRDDEHLRDADFFEQRIGVGQVANLILHGHTHEGKVHWTGDRVAILSTGSAALDPAQRPPDVPNQYQLVTVSADGLVVRGRGFDPGRSRWIADPRVSAGGNDWIAPIEYPLRDVGQALASRGSAAAPIEPSAVPFDDRDPPATRRTSPFFDFVLPVCRLRHARADSVEIQVRSVPAHDLHFIEVRWSERRQVRVYAVVPCDGTPDNDFCDIVREAVHGAYSRHDPGVRSIIVHPNDRPPGAETVQRSEACGVDVVGFGRFQGLIDFQGYLAEQRRRLDAATPYPPSLYVPQRLEVRLGPAPRDAADALESIHAWLLAPEGCFVLVLGDFGTGKTFLLHQLARRLDGPESLVVPILVDMRSLEKGRSLEELVVQHLVGAGVQQIDLDAFTYMMEEGRLALLFDGFDELALRVRYERAAEHLATILKAARGRAKIVLTSRTQHFESEAQVLTALGTRVALVEGRRLVSLGRFDGAQIELFLERMLGKPSAARERRALIGDIEGLLGLAENPRMLSFIARIPEHHLREAMRAGAVTAATLYGVLIDTWLRFERERAEGPGIEPGLEAVDRLEAVTSLAVQLWQTTRQAISLDELSRNLAATLERLARTELDPGVATHMVGSGTLLVRDASGAFSFAHQSLLEWLVARRAAGEPEADPVSLGLGDMSGLMIKFFCELRGRESALRTAEAISLRQDAPAAAQRNAERIARHHGVELRPRPSLRGEDHSGGKLSGQDLRGRDHSEAKFVEAQLVRTDLRDATLVGADFTDADVREAALSGADVTRTRFVRADLRGADLRGARGLAEADFTRARLLGAQIDAGAGASMRAFGAALPDLPLELCLRAAAHRSIVAWHPGGRLLAIGDARGFTLIDARTDQHLRRFPTSAVITSLRFDAVGTHAAAGCTDGGVRTWEVGTGRVLPARSGHKGAVYGVAFSPDGRRLASASHDATVIVWESSTGRILRSFGGVHGFVSDVAFSRDGGSIAAACADGTVRLWEAATGKLLKTMGAAGRGAMYSVAFSSDGHLLACGDGNKLVHTFDARTGRIVHTLGGHEGPVYHVAFSPDGTRLASASADGTARLWDARQGLVRHTLAAHTAAVFSVDFSTNGRYLASGGHDEAIVIWDAETGRRIKTFSRHGHAITGLDVQPNGMQIAATGSDHALRLWDLHSCRLLRTLVDDGGIARAPCFNHLGTRVATGSNDGCVQLWDPSTGAALDRFSAEAPSPILGVRFSPDDTLIAAGCGDRTVVIWDVLAGKRRHTLRGHPGPVVGIAFSSDGGRLAAAGRPEGEGGNVRIWNTGAGRFELTLEGPLFDVSCVAFNVDGSRVAAGSGGTGDHSSLRLWDPASGKLVLELAGQDDAVTCIAFNRYGTRLVSGSSDGSIRLWDPATGQLLRSMHCAHGAARALALSGDGTRLCVGDSEGHISIWNMNMQQETPVAIARATRRGGWVAFTPEGRFKAGGDIDGDAWFASGLCRFEIDEVDVFTGARRVAADRPMDDGRLEPASTSGPRPDGGSP